MYERLRQNPGLAVVVMDWKMKLLQNYHRESQPQFFAKRGLPVMGVMFQFYGPAPDFGSLPAEWQAVDADALTSVVSSSALSNGSLNLYNFAASAHASSSSSSSAAAASVASAALPAASRQQPPASSDDDKATKLRTIVLTISAKDSSENGVQSLICALIARNFIKCVSPQIKEIIIRADNAGCFAGADFTVGLALANYDYDGPRFVEKSHNESGKGKSALDAFFSYLTRAVNRFVDAGHDLTTASDCLRMLAWSATGESACAVRGSIGLMIDFPETTLKAKFKGSDSAFKFLYEANGGELLV